MAWRIGEHVVAGELINTSRNSVHGWLDFGEDWGIRIALTGNLEGKLKGRHIKFRSSQPASPRAERELSELADEQVGATGSMTLLIRRIPRGNKKEWWRQFPLSLRPPTDEKPCLYLEWFSQNGRVVAELVEPEIEYADGGDEAGPCPLPETTDEGIGPDIIAIERSDDGIAGTRHILPAEDDDGDDQYGLFDSGLEDQVAESSGMSDAGILPFDEEPRRRSWDEVIPGISDETRKMYEQWDEIVDGDKDEPLISLFDPPLSVPKADQIYDEQEAEHWLKMLLARLAKHSVALDVCEHFSPMDCYRLLMNDILPEAQIHPDLTATGFVRHFSTWESCEKCQAEIDED